ncbi:MAG: 2Fe-2S iron-sulfur cluster-binding protein, partial [Planktomarina sp.]|nr:2Fe-2S iron-sulfur cluster-binding protein [Planktomarina sp.]
MRLLFHWNNDPVLARAGDSIAAALTVAGIQILGKRRSGRTRGQFCGMGVCQDCLVVVDGMRSQRACMTEVRDGMTVTPQSDTEFGSLFSSQVVPDPMNTSVDLAIIGAGPAGLNAALVASVGGAKVCIIDERHQIGGQYYKPRSDGYRDNLDKDQQHLNGQKLREQVESAGVEIRTGETVWYARDTIDGLGFELRTEGAFGQACILARAVILATGAMERPAMIPGWTRPG